VFVVKVIDAALREAGVGRAHVLSVGGAVGAKNTVALLAGHRLGAGVVTVGTLLRGANGGVGEVFVLRHIQGVDPPTGSGTVSRPGRRGRGVGLRAPSRRAIRCAPCRRMPWRRGPSSGAPAPLRRKVKLALHLLAPRVQSER
jgi:hypothetical protein